MPSCVWYPNASRICYTSRKSRLITPSVCPPPTTHTHRLSFSLSASILNLPSPLPPFLNHDAATGFPLGTASVSPTFSETAASPFSFFSSTASRSS